MNQPRANDDVPVGYLIKHAQSTLRARMDESLRALGLTTPQYSCLEAIQKNPGFSTAEIARLVFVSRQTMATLLKGLQARGFVEKADRAASGRALPLMLTEAGRGLLREARVRVEEIDRALRDGLGRESYQALVRSLGDCAALLDGLPPEGHDR